MTDAEGGVPEFTERHLAVLPKAVPTDSLLRTLSARAGIRSAPAADFSESGNPGAPAHGEAVLFEQLGVAVINAAPEQIGFAKLPGSEVFTTLQRERVRRAALESARADATPTDSERVTTWGLQSTRVDVCEYFGAGTRICVLDSGIELAHPDVQPSRTRSFTDIPDVRDRVGHGTHCAATIAGARVPSRGPRYGIACDAELYVGKVFDSAESWSRSTDGQLIAGIHWALAHRCDVVSMSLGEAPGDTYSEVFEHLARSALDAGTLLVASAGNDSQRLQQPPLREPVDHPANCPSILAVGAVDSDLDVLISSNAGLRIAGGTIDLVAPGANIHSAWMSPAFYARRHGTSMAVPFVAGIAALWIEATGLRGRTLWQLLLAKARPLPLPSEDVGHGLVQAPREGRFRTSRSS